MPRGSQPGERRGGRQKGTPNKASKWTAPLREMAGEYTEEAVKVFVSVMRSSDAPPAARVIAADRLLDRAHGKPAQALEHSGPDGGPIPIARIVNEFVSRD